MQVLHAALDHWDCHEGLQLPPGYDSDQMEDSQTSLPETCSRLSVNCPGSKCGLHSSLWLALCKMHCVYLYIVFHADCAVTSLHWVRNLLLQPCMFALTVRVTVYVIRLFDCLIWWCWCYTRQTLSTHSTLSSTDPCCQNAKSMPATGTAHTGHSSLERVQ